jgi:hypothetical protein
MLGTFAKRMPTRAKPRMLSMSRYRADGAAAEPAVGAAGAVASTLGPVGRRSW